MALEANGSADKLAVYATLAAENAIPEIMVEKLHADFWARYTASFKPFPEAMSTLGQLRHARVKLGIVTNGTIRIQEQKIDALGLRDLIDVVVISEREGIRKPAAEIFNVALARLGVAAATDAWFVGDNPDVDVVGAYRAGLRAFWLQSTEWAPPAVPCDTIVTLDELLPFVRKR